MLVLDRTLTPVGERRLKDLRCLGRGSEFAWPSPGVFSVAGLAEKILVGLARRGEGTRGPREIVGDEELVLGLWNKKNRAVRLKAFQRELREALKLAPLGLSPREWSSLMSEMQEDSAAGELRVWSERILLYLEAWAFASETGQALTKWDHVYRVVHEVDAENLKDLPWIALLERHPFRTEGLRFTVPEVQDPQPLEDALLRKLPLPVVRLRVEADDEFPLEDLPRLPDAAYESADDLAFAWAFDAPPPGPVETVTALPGTYPVDVTAKTWEDDNEELRILALYCASLAEPGHPQHAFYRYESRSAFLKTWGLGKSATVDEVLSSWRRAREALAPDRGIDLGLLPMMKGLSLSELSEVFAYLSESPLFRVERRAFRHARLDPRGAPLVTLVDLGFMGARSYALWGIQKDFEKHLAPTSTAILRRQDFPSSLRRLLEARGHWLPDPEREQRALLGALATLKGRLFTIETRPLPRAGSLAAPAWRVPELARREVYSPSALESYAECSMRFYIERVLRPGRVGDWDPVPLDPLDTGLWVHAVLEDFLKSPRWDSPLPTLRLILESRRSEIFNTPSSSAYSRILDQESEILAEKLVEHVLEFERPLLALMGARVRLETETPLASRFQGRLYNGKLDRLDHYAHRRALLWDYKTGTIAQAASLKQISNHKFQWHLYRSMLHELRPDLRVAGGGYLNPLDPSKSRLLLFPSHFPADSLEGFRNLCESLGHPLEVIDDEGALTEALTREVEGLRVRLSEGRIAPDGDAKKVCVRCTSHGVCGKPYLEGNSEDDDLA